jgi:hypothetical protein
MVAREKKHKCFALGTCLAVIIYESVRLTLAVFYIRAAGGEQFNVIYIYIMYITICPFVNYPPPSPPTPRALLHTPRVGWVGLAEARIHGYVHLYIPVFQVCQW